MDANVEQQQQQEEIQMVDLGDANDPGQGAQGSATDDQQDSYELVMREEPHTSNAVEKEQDEQRKRNAAFARLRRERDEFERKNRELQQGYIPQELQQKIGVQAQLPAMPTLDQFPEEKFEWNDTARMAAYQAAIANWQLDVATANNDAQFRSSQNLRHHAEQQARFTQAYGTYVDRAEKLNLPDFEQTEEVARQLLPQGWDQEIISRFGQDAPALMYYLGKNPAEVARLKNMDSVDATIELTRLSNRLDLRKTNVNRISRAGEADSPLSGNVPVNDALAKLEKLANSGDIAGFRALKKQLKAKGINV